MVGLGDAVVGFGDAVGVGEVVDRVGLGVGFALGRAVAGVAFGWVRVGVIVAGALELGRRVGAGGRVCRQVGRGPCVFGGR